MWSSWRLHAWEVTDWAVFGVQAWHKCSTPKFLFWGTSHPLTWNFGHFEFGTMILYLINESINFEQQTLIDVVECLNNLHQKICGCHTHIRLICSRSHVLICVCLLCINFNIDFIIQLLIGCTIISPLPRYSWPQACHGRLLQQHGVCVCVWRRDVSLFSRGHG